MSTHTPDDANLEALEDELKALYDDNEASLKALEDDFRAKLKALYDASEAKRKEREA